MRTCFAFDHFMLDTADRRLKGPEGPVELNGRYFDALVLLVAQKGQLVSKAHFLAEVWRGIPVTDEALTQCIKTLRRQLGDDASNPRFIETVPKHGYRFIAPVRNVGELETTAPSQDNKNPWRDFIVTGTSGMLGGGASGIIGGLLYGFLGASQSSHPEIGGLSTLLVILCVTIAVALLGAAGVSFAIATAAFARTRSWYWLVLAGSAGGLIVGATVKLLGRDAFTLLFGHAPIRITGAMEGLLLGAAVGLSAAFGFGGRSLRAGAAIGALFGALSALTATMLGGQLMLGSMIMLEREFPGSRLRVDQIGRLFGETGFGPVSQALSSALEGGLFSSFVVVAMMVGRRTLAAQRH